jgi:hypothetical protein
VEVEEEIAAIAVVGGVKVDAVVEEEVGVRHRWGIGGTRRTFMLSRNDHKTNDTLVLRYFWSTGHA